MRNHSNAIDLHIGRKLRMRRLELKVSQENLADALCISFQQIQKYEKGTNRISPGRLMAAADALQVTPAYFYEGAPGKHSEGTPDELSSFMATADGVALVQAF